MFFHFTKSVILVVHGIRLRKDVIHKMYLFFNDPKNPETGFLSQWFKADIVDKQDVCYNSTGQYMLYKKAQLFEDEATASKILDATEPKTQRKLGRKINNFKKSIWDEHKWDIVKEGNRIKFEQNEDLKEKLLETSGKYLVYMSPTDSVWGTGISGKNSFHRDPNNWGENLLGEILTVLRNDFENAN